MKTLQELIDARAHKLDEIDVIVNTAKEAKRSLTDDERTQHDALVVEIEGKVAADGTVEVEGIDHAIRAAQADASDAVRFQNQEARRTTAFPVPAINVRGSYSPGAEVSRNLDHFLWATAPTVQATNGRSVNPVDQVIVRSSVNDPGTQAPRISAFVPDHHQAIRNFQRTVTDMCLVGMLVDKDADSSKKGFEVARSLPQFKDRWTEVLRALDVDTSAEGTEWVPTGIGATLHEKVRASGKIAPLFQRITLPTNPWKWPLEGADAVAYRVAEPTADNASKVTASTPGTAAATFDAEIFGARTLWSKSLDADSAIAILSFVEGKLVQAFVDAEEKAILDGDADGTHQDADVQAIGAIDARTAWDGLRKRALAQTVITNQTTSTAANLALLRAAMLRWGLNPADLAFIVGMSAYYDLLADTSVLTVDKLGPNATILNGQLASVHGVPIIVSEHVREDLNATGVQDGIVSTKTYNMCVNRNEFAIGQRMALDVETDDSIYRESFQRVAVMFQREDFQSISAGSTDDTVCLAYNITP